MGPLNIKNLISLILIMTALVVVQQSYAQEEGFMIDNPELNEQREPVQIVREAGEYRQEESRDEHNKSEKSRQVKPDKEEVAPAKVDKRELGKTSNTTTSNTTPQSTPDDSVLSFNFLYYIIQKFKFSDVVDQ